jgi:uncharacterized protein YxjI
MALTGSVHPMRVMSPIDGARDSGELHGGVKADGRTAKTVFGSTDVRYQMRQRLISIGDDFTISDQEGNAAFKVDGKALRVRETLILQDLDGNDLCKIQARMLRVRDTMEIEDGDGNSAATVKKALISPFRDRFHVEIANGPALEVKGNIVEHNYRLERDGETVAEVSKKWFRVADSYGVEVAPGQNDALVLAIAVALDHMAHPAR